MINLFRRATSTLALGAALCLLNSCSQNTEDQPAPQTAVADASIRTVNGRLIFPSDQAFYTLRDKVLFQKTPAELDQWEKEHGFKSLRQLPLEAEGEALNLLTQFHFPSSYAALINADGEYQIAERIYWFHEGFKYEAKSEEELARIKQNPSIAAVKFQAGAQLVDKMSQQEGPNGTTTASREVRGADNTSGDRRWVGSTFGWDGRDRRITIETFIYSEDVTGQFVAPVPAGQAPNGTFYTSVVLSIYREYYNRKWYRGGEPMNISYDVNCNGTVGTYNTGWELYYAGNPAGQRVANGIYYTGGGNFTTNLMYSYVRNTNGNTGYKSYYWTYDIVGTISAAISQSTNNTYTITGNLW